MKLPEARTVTGELQTPTPQPIRLSNAEEIRRELAAVYRDMRRGSIDMADGSRLAYVLDLMRRAYETEVLQRRIEMLERTLDARKVSNET